MAQKFTRIPKVSYLISQGIPAYVIPTYCALADYSNNKTALCWPRMSTLAQTLGVSVRTIQRHLRALEEAGLIQFVERRRNKGRYSSYLYKILAVFSTGHKRPVNKRVPNRRRTKPVPTTPKPPKKTREDYRWFFQ